MSVNISKFGMTSGSKNLTVSADVSAEIMNRIKADIKINDELKIQSDFDTAVTQRLATVEGTVSNLNELKLPERLTTMEYIVYEIKELDIPQQISDVNGGLLGLGMNQLTFRSDLTKETKARSDADTALQTQVNGCATYENFTNLYLQISNVNGYLQTEIQDRTDADTKIRTDVNGLFADEAKSRSLTQGVLQTNIDNEAKARSDTDAALSANITTLNALTARRYAIVNFGTPGVSNGKIAHIVSGTTPEFVVSTQGSGFGFKEIEVGDNLTLTQDTKSIMLNLDGVATTAALTAETKARTDADTAIMASIPTSVSGTTTIVFNSTANGGTVANVPAKYTIMLNTVVVLILNGFSCNIGTVAKDYILSQPVPALIRPYIALTVVVGIRKNALTDALGKLTFGNSGEMLLEDFDSTGGYFPANATGAGTNMATVLTYLLA